MQVCPHCSKENPDVDAYCYSCGHILPAALADLIGATGKLEEEVYETLEPRRRWGTAYFDRQTRLQLHLRDANENMIVLIEDEVVVGRVHSEPGIPLPDVDLSAYDALDKGVSRIHLSFMRDHDTVVVTDLGSANHTYLNGQRLLAYEPRILRDNDELRLGRLVIRVSFV